MFRRLLEALGSETRGRRGGARARRRLLIKRGEGRQRRAARARSASATPRARASSASAAAASTGLIVLGHDLLDARYLGGVDALARLDTVIVLDSARTRSSSASRTWCSRRASPPRSAARSPTTRAACSACEPAVEPALRGARRGRGARGARRRARAAGLRRPLRRARGLEGARRRACPPSRARRLDAVGDDGRAARGSGASMLVEVLVKSLFILLVVVAALAPVITWIERKQSAVMQDRIGANRADIGGHHRARPAAPARRRDQAALEGGRGPVRREPHHAPDRAARSPRCPR